MSRILVTILLEQVQKFNEGKILTRFKQLGHTALNFRAENRGEIF